jgi:hypothetical protein
MKSKWFEYKEAAISLRKTGMSMTTVERKLGIPRSTLSNWFKDIPLTEEQRTRLMKNKQDGWLRARQNAVISHRAQKEQRLLDAKNEATKTLDQVDLTDPILELAFAMMYWGEGAKSGGTSMASSDPDILRFMLIVLKRCYGVKIDSIRCDLHLRVDQDAEMLKKYWSDELKLPLQIFKYVAFDKRSAGKPTYDHYKGVCVISCGNIAIQRKIMYLYKLFCEKISQLDTGA